MSKSSVTWKQVVGYEGYYEVSDQGSVRSVDRTVKGKGGSKYLRKGKRMALKIDRYGYPCIGLRNGSRGFFTVHTLVARAFIGKRPDDCNQLNHKDSDKTNNTPANLEYCTGSHNQRHAYQAGTHALCTDRNPETGRMMSI